MLNLLVCYHDKCTDGFMAAANVAKHLDQSRFKATYLPVNYGITVDALEDALTDVNIIYFVDFCIQDEAELSRLLKHPSSFNVVILDHHASTKQLLLDFPVETYDNFTVILTEELSGAGLVGSLGDVINDLYINEEIDQGRLTDIVHQGVHILTNTSHAYSIDPSQLDRLTKAVNARDLWLNDLDMQTGLYFDAYAKQYQLFFHSTPETVYDNIERHGGITNILSEGEVIFSTIYKACQTAVDNAKKTVLDIGGRTIRVVVGLNPYGYGSTFGEIAYSIDDLPTVVCGVGYNVASGNIGLSLRSNKSCRVRQIAADLFGGGGHDQASGAGMVVDGDLPVMKIHNSIVDYIIQHPDNVFN